MGIFNKNDQDIGSLINMDKFCYEYLNDRLLKSLSLTLDKFNSNTDQYTNVRSMMKSFYVDLVTRHKYYSLLNKLVLEGLISKVFSDKNTADFILTLNSTWKIVSNFSSEEKIILLDKVTDSICVFKSEVSLIPTEMIDRISPGVYRDIHNLIKVNDWLIPVILGSMVLPINEVNKL